ncbi:MAG: type IV secretion system protein [Marinovum algicola]|uniref:type IV secretion system protein n=1 Tax=Roseobacteraceae TaxID=2854170 RepID=UPI0032EFA988
MRAEPFLRSFVTAATLALTALPSARAQGVPVIDGSNLAQNVEQLQAALRDAENQLQQIEEMRRQIERLTDIQGLLDDVLSSITGLNEIAALYNDVQDLRDRAQKITDLSGFMEDLSLGDFDGLIDNLLDGEVTMGSRRAADAMRETMATAGFTGDTLTELNAADNPQGAAIADLAAANAMVIGQAQISYEEAARSLERIDGLVEAIGDQDTLKESIDLNTRMAAETNYMLGQMWWLNAAQGLAQGQNGIDFAAEQARTRSFFDFSGAED